MRWAGRAASIIEMRNANKIMSDTCERGHLEDLGVDGSMLREDEMSGACSTHSIDKNAYKI
jgi:hypothetical protein